MEYPAYSAFTKRFSEGPETYLEKLSMAQLLCIAKDLKIAFVPPFEEDTPADIVRASIIDAAVSDFQNPGQDEQIIRAIENCLS
jgi:hypothetical protein